MLRRHTVRLARRDLAWTLTAFAFVQLGLAGAIEAWLPQFRDPYYGYRAGRLLRRYWTERPVSVLALGSSHVQNGLMPALLEPVAAQQIGRPVMVFNFGVPAAGPVVNLLNYRRLRSAGFRPDLVLIEVVPACLSVEGSLPESSDLRADRLSWPEVTWLGRYGLPVGELARDWWERSLLPTHGHRFALLAWFAPDLVPAPLRLDWSWHLDDSGWQEPMVGAATAETRCRNTAASATGYRFHLARFRANPAVCRALEDLLAECRRDELPAALLRMPEASAIRACYPPAVEAWVHGYVDDLRQRYGVSLIDARGWVRDDAFLDGRHLAVAGARVFTQRLGREALFPALTKTMTAPPPR
jgi:hypothetical protein